MVKKYWDIAVIVLPKVPGNIQQGVVVNARWARYDSSLGGFAIRGVLSFPLTFNELTSFPSFSAIAKYSSRRIIESVDLQDTHKGVRRAALWPHAQLGVLDRLYVFTDTKALKSIGWSVPKIPKTHSPNLYIPKEEVMEYYE